MDKYIIIFSTIAKARVYSDKLHTDNVADAASKGYTIINNEIVGKNARTGEDMPNAQRTIAWRIPLDVGDGTFAIEDESGEIKFSTSLDTVPNDYIRKINFIGDGAFLREDGSLLLREDGGKILRESSKYV